MRLRCAVPRSLGQGNEEGTQISLPAVVPTPLWSELICQAREPAA
jgi:hypothetical protein